MSTNAFGRIGLVALAVGVGVGLAAAPASAAPRPTGGQLSVYRDPGDPNFTRVTMAAHYPMNQADAQGYLNNVGNGGMEFLLYADDEGDGDGIKQRFWAPRADQFPGYHIAATSTGLNATLVVNLPNGALNEDNGQDEFYVKATFVDGDGGRRSQFTNDISGNWP